LQQETQILLALRPLQHSRQRSRRDIKILQKERDGV